MIYLYILYALSCLVCLAHVFYFRHNLATTRLELLAYAIVACVPVLNVIIVAVGWHAPKTALQWWDKPFD